MYEKRALYLNDLKFEENLYFLYNEKTQTYVLSTNDLVSYPKEIVENDDCFMLYEVPTDKMEDVRIIRNFQEENRQEGEE